MDFCDELHPNNNYIEIFGKTKDEEKKEIKIGAYHCIQTHLSIYFDTTFDLFQLFNVIL